MPKFKVSQTQVHRVDRIYTEEFDTDSQEQWDELKAKAEDMMDEDEFAELPDDPPEDLEIWLSVYRCIDGGEYSDLYDDWVTDRKGGYEIVWQVYDEEGNIVVEE